MTTYVVGFMFTEELRRVLLIRKKRPTWMAGKLNGVGGHIEPGETPEHAMVREFREETGSPTLEQDWTKVLNVVGNGYWLHIFRQEALALPSTAFKEEGPLAEQEQLEIHAVDHVANLARMNETVDGISWMLPLCADLEITQLPITIYYGLKGDKG